MLEVLKHYEWEYAFQCAGEENLNGSEDMAVDIREKVPGSGVSLAPFTRDDVVSILQISTGEEYPYQWSCSGQLKDGRKFELMAQRGKCWCEWAKGHVVIE